MKKLIQLTLLLLAILLPVTASAQYQDFYYQGIYYRMEYYGATNVSVIGYDSGSWSEYFYGGEVTIPSQIPRNYYNYNYDDEYYTVTSIESEAFENCSELRSIYLPSTITKIGYEAFWNCSNLVTVSFSYWDCELTTIDSYAFEGCSSLTNIELPSSLTNISYRAFEDCTSLTNITIPSSVTYMESEVFYGCSNLSHVNCYGAIGERAFSGCNKLTDANCYGTIGESAFKNCTALRYLDFEWGEQDSISIGNYAFQGCTALTSVNISKSVKSIGKSIFAGCNNLGSITVDSRNPLYDSRDNCNGIIETSSNTLVTTCKNTTIPSSVTTIGGYAYYGSGLTSLSLPNSISTIADYGLYGCSSLTSITMPNVTTIGNSAFSGCDNLSNIAMPNVTVIGNSSFNGCKNISNLVFPSTLTIIGSSAFNGCTRLSSITIPNSVTTIGNNAFYGCSIASSATIGSSVSSIGSSAFGNCSNISTLVVADGNTYYDSRNDCNAIIETGSNKLVQGCKNTTIPNTVTLIGDSAFYYCTSLTSITIPNTVTAIGDYAFYNCTSLSNATIGNSVTTIGNSAFYKCTSLTSIIIPAAVTTIKDYAFAYSRNLSTVDLPNSISIIGTDVFYQTAWLNNQPNGVIYAGLIAYSYKGSMPSGTSVILRDGTIGIADHAFSNQSGLSSIDIPNSVTFIGEEAFYNCDWLSSVTIPDSVTTIGNRAFSGCYRLSEVTIGNSVTSIGANAFGSGYYDDYYTDESSSSLSKVYISDLDAWCNITFEGPNSNPCTYAHHLYLNGEELHNLVIPSTVTSIKDYVFLGCSEITSVEIPSSITSIGNFAFAKTGLTSVNIPNSVTFIGSNAFHGCSSLVTVSLGNSINTIGYSAFEVGNYDYYTEEYTSSLTGVYITDLAVWCNILFLESSSNPCTYAHHLYLNGEEIHNLVIPGTVTSIKDYAFMGCSEITSVEIPSSVTTIGNDAFYGCTGLKNLQWSPKNCTSNGSMPTSNLDRITIGSQVEIIPNGFASSSKISSIIIPNSVKSIGFNAFLYCTQLRNMFFNAQNCTSIGSNAFSSTNNVNYLQFGDSVEHIPAGLPTINMTNKKLVLPNSVKTIEAGSLKGSCAGVVLGNSIQNLANNTFPTGMKVAYTDKTEPIPCESGAFVSPQTLYVPSGSRMKYFTSIGWSEFANILEGEYVRVDSIQFAESVAIPRTYTCQLNTTLVPSNATTTTLNWMSNNTNIATVSSSGVITAVAEGETDIIAYVDNTMSICHVTVTPIYVTKITLSDSALSMTVDDMTSLTATVSPSNAENKELEWIIPDNDVLATIQVNNNKLNIGALSEGHVTITVRATDGSDVSATCMVNVVSSIPVSQLSIAPEEANLHIGDNLQLNPTILPNNANNKALNWSSSNRSVATVDQNGLVTAVAPGTVTITATTVDGSNLTASCTVTVEQNVVLATSITLNQTSAGMNEGETLQLTATVMPEDATDRTVTWASSDETVATVDQSGLVTAVAPGMVTITATTVDGSNLTASCTVTVEPNIVHVNSIELNQTSAGMNEGETLQLTATVMPEDATDRTVTWASSDETVATVDQNGLVTAVAAGTAIITASANDSSDLSASCEVTVNGSATANNTLDADALSIHTGEEKQLAVRMDNEASITALQCDIYLPAGLSIVTEDGDYLIDLVPARKATNHTVSTNDLPNGAIRLFITSATSKPFKGNSGDLFILNLVVDEDAESGEYSIDLRNVILSDTEAHPYYAPDLIVPVTVLDYIKGDVNIDGTVNVSDYVATANFILELDPHPFLFAAADIDENHTINVSDLVGVANIALNFMGVPAVNRTPAMGNGGVGMMELASNCISFAPDRYVMTLDLSNSSAVTAFQMDINLPNGMKLMGATLSDRATASHSLEMTELANGAYRLLGASMMSKAFAGNEGALLTLEIEGTANGMAIIDGIMLAEPDATMHEHAAMILTFGASGVHEMYNDVRIYTEDGKVVVESPMATKVQFILPNGMSATREVKPGRNVYNMGFNGVVIVKVNEQVKKFKL